MARRKTRRKSSRRSYRRRRTSGGGRYAVRLSVVLFALGLGLGVILGVRWDGAGLEDLAAKLEAVDREAETVVASRNSEARAPGRRVETQAPEARRRPAPQSKETWQSNAARYPPPPGAPRVAIVIDDLGINTPNSRDAIALPAPLTLAFLSYARGLPDMTTAARAAGHELLVHVPMQPTNGEVDPGPKVLRADSTAATLRARLDWALSRFDGYVGINNHMGSAFTADSSAMRRVLAELKRRELLFLDSRTTAETTGTALAAELGVPHAARDVFLDNVQEVAAIRRNLAKAEAIARDQGFAVAIGHPHDATLAALRDWIPEARRRGIVLVPISAVVTGGGAPERLAGVGG